jgi:uncharacterized protein YbjT (DUF2867 family)
MNGVAVLAGSTGLIGRECLRLLLADPRYREVVALVRRPQSVHHAKYRELVVDFARLDTLLPFAADAFCALGTTQKIAGSKEAFHRVDYEYVLNFAYWARAGGGESFQVVSSIGADESSGSFYLATKGEMEAGLREQRFPKLNIFRPSVLLGSREEFRLGERIAAGLLRAAGGLMIGPLTAYRAIPGAVVAKAMVASAKEEGASGVRVHTYREIVRLAATAEYAGPYE